MSHYIHEDKIKELEIKANGAPPVFEKYKYNISKMSELHIIEKPITRTELKKIAEERFGDLVKAAVDIEQGIMAVGGEFHMDEQTALFEEKGSKQQNIWGINIYPDDTGEGFIEFDSMINLKPNQGNRTRNIQDRAIREKITSIVKRLVV